ncbi:hypothetical protein Dimus_037839 [Dionaea muscipula]
MAMATAAVNSGEGQRPTAISFPSHLLPASLLLLSTGDAVTGNLARPAKGMAGVSQRSPTSPPPIYTTSATTHGKSKPKHPTTHKSRLAQNHHKSTTQTSRSEHDKVGSELTFVDPSSDRRIRQDLADFLRSLSQLFLDPLLTRPTQPPVAPPRRPRSVAAALGSSMPSPASSSASTGGEDDEQMGQRRGTGEQRK